MKEWKKNRKIEILNYNLLVGGLVKDGGYDVFIF